MPDHEAELEPDEQEGGADGDEPTFIDPDGDGDVDEHNVQPPG